MRKILATALATGALALLSAAPSLNLGETVYADCDGWSIAVSHKADSFVKIQVKLYKQNADLSWSLYAADIDGAALNSGNGWYYETGDIWDKELACASYRANFGYAVYEGYQKEPPADARATFTIHRAVEFKCGCATILARTPGFWKNHPSAWPVTSLSIGGDTYTQAQLMTILDTPVRGDITIILAKHLIAAKLNLAAGVSGTVLGTTIADADDYLDDHPIGSKPTGTTKQEGGALKDTLDAFNNNDL